MTEILITSSVLILALLLMRKLFQKSLSRRVQYALWGLVLLRLLIPVNLPAIDFSVLSAAKPVEEAVTRTVTERPVYVPVAQAPLKEHPLARKVAPEHTLTAVGNSVWIAQEEQQTAVQYKRISPETILFWVWLAGCVTAAAFLLLTNLRFWLRLRKVRKPYEVEGCKLPVYMVETGLSAPCLFGLFRPAVYLTPGAAETPDSVRHVLAHETTHARHLDHVWTFLRGVCLALYWFDPLVWLAAKAAKADCELACDEGALARLEEEDRIPYGETLLSLAVVREAGNPMLAATAMTTGKKHLKERITRIAHKSRQTAAAVVAVALLVSAVSACTFTEGISGKVVVCFDVGAIYESDYYQDLVQSFLNWIDDCNKYLGLGISSEDIELDVIPGAEADPSERAAVLQRLRTEIMSGKGPDVFICRTQSNFTTGDRFGETTVSLLDPVELGIEETVDSTRLFPYVEKSREEGLFLPLDDLLPDLTLTDTDDLIPQLLEGGKNKAGEQVIIPLTFSVPGIVFSGTTSNPLYGNELPEVNFEGTSWDDVLRGDDPLLSELSVWAMNYGRNSEDYIRTGRHASALFCLFPETADFENEVPALSEEELFALVKDSIESCRRTMDREPEQYSASVFFEPYNLNDLFGAWAIPHRGNDPYTLVPMRNLQGGSTAMVNSYCAINANTRKKEKALAVLDALLTIDYQRNSSLLYFVGGMPNSRTLTSPGNPYLQSVNAYSGTMEFTAEQFAQWQRICEDINIVRFPGPLDDQLDRMMSEIEDTMYTYRSPAGAIIRNGQFLQYSLSDEELKEIISRHYQQMQRLLDES